MDLARVAIHEAGHFLVAYKFNPKRAVNIYIGRYNAIDSKGNPYVALGYSTTFDPPETSARLLVAIRAAGIAAESLVFGETLDQLMVDPDHRWEIKTDTDNATKDLEREGLSFEPQFWEAGFLDASTMLRTSRNALRAIADYCLANQGRKIPRDELERIFLQ